MSNSRDKGFTTGSPQVEELRHAFEAGLEIVDTEKPNCNTNEIEMVCISCIDENKQWHKGISASVKLNSDTNNDGHPQVEEVKPFQYSGEPVLGKPLLKCASFPCSVQLDMLSLDMCEKEADKTENGIQEGEQSLEQKNAPYSRTLSLPSCFKIIPALRGGQERSGLGPRPKLSVKWAPDVQEPQPSSVSHTVKSYRQYSSKKKDKKHKHKGKSSHTSESNKSCRKRHTKRNYNSESDHSRLQSSTHGNSILLDVWASRNSMLIPVKSQPRGLGVPLFNMQIVQDDILVNASSKHYCEEHELSSKGISDSELLSQLKCADSYMHSIQNKHLSCSKAEAA